MDIKVKLKNARQELLDLTLRNPLLNYRLLKSRGLEIIGVNPEELYNTLVIENKSLTFIPQENDENDQGQEVFKSEEQENLNRGGQKIKTCYIEKELQSRLLSTYLAAKTYIEEQGVNILFITLGMLLWKEDDSSDKYLKSPLILIPVELNRSNARERFTLSYTQEDVQLNVSLAAKLLNDFSIKLPIHTDDDTVDVVEYCQKVKDSIMSQPKWKVDTESIALGFFSFGKFLMYNDLNIDLWPEEINPEHHPIMKALLDSGFREPDSLVGDNEHIDQKIDPRNLLHVVEADSSQTIAINDVVSGRNIVIQGPPGTGKSQTITNIVAELIARGKKVLFVSEKMAALEVVKRRLDRIGLGDACLELHSNKANKKVLLNELQRVLDLGEPKLSENSNEYQELYRTCSYLNEYCNAVNTPIGKSGVSPYRAYGELLRIGRIIGRSGINLPRVMIKNCTEWTKEDFLRKNDLVNSFQESLRSTGVPSEHPFWCTSRHIFLPGDKDVILDKLKDFKETSNEFSRLSKELSKFLQSQEVSGRIDLDKLMATAERILDAPNLSGLDIKSDVWYSEPDKIMEIINTGVKYNSNIEKFKDKLIQEAWEQDVFSIRQDFAFYKDKWWRFLSLKYRNANLRAGYLFNNSAKRTYEEKLEALEVVLEQQRLKKYIEQCFEFGKEVFSRHWKLYDTRWNELLPLAGWLIKTYEEANILLDMSVEPAPAYLSQDRNRSFLLKELIGFIEHNGDKKALGILVCEVKKLKDAYENKITHITELLEIDISRRFGSKEAFLNLPYAILDSLTTQWQERIDEIQLFVVYNHFVDSIKDEQISEILETANNWDKASEFLNAVFLNEWYQALLSKAFQERQILASFERNQHESIANKYSQLDEKLIQLNRVKIAHQHWKGVPKHSSEEGQLGVLLWEFQKKSRHLPIRQLISKAGNVIQAIKPVMMMSPLSIASYIDPNSLKFDVAIFDEASQVRPVDAFGAILRSKQTIVVGDSCQMPPTSFFDFVAGNNDELDENSVSDIESILGLFVAQGAPQRMLRWHYRSKHESLIMVSNQEFYRSKLIVFPSAEAIRSNIGLKFNYIPDSAYDRGKSRTNIKEARYVAQAVIEHAKNSPELTLGVAAFSVAQMQAIIDQLEAMRKENPICEDFFQAHPEEPFFVKNLENVQGDERDVIFISVGYGKTEEGYLDMNFGPLNKTGGERRLNVLITRARQKCEVFTNITADDIDLGRSNARGVQCLKTFLMYAKEGKLDLSTETDKDFDSPFEEDVFYKLIDKGFNVKRQVGCAGFSVDLAVVDPKRPSKYLLGIECDGATYHSARSARDRDRLRQRILENKGWNIHRIWSTDWFRNPEKEMTRLISSIEKVKAREFNEPIDKHQIRNDTIIDRSSETIKMNNHKSAQQYVVANIPHVSDIALYTPQYLIGHIISVVNKESPVHINEVIRRIVDASNAKRAGSQIRESIENAIDIVIRQRTIIKRGNFLWLISMKTPIVRNRKELPNQAKRIDYIADEEIALAIKSVINSNYGMQPSEVPQAVGHLFGFSRITEEIEKEITTVMNKLVKAGEVRLQGNNYVVNM